MPGSGFARRNRALAAGGLCVALLAGGFACSRPDPRSAADTAAVAHDASEAASALANADARPAGIVRSRAGGVLRIELDELAYAPLSSQALVDGDEPAWRTALPATVLRSERTEPRGDICDGDERIVRFEDVDARNKVELRACAGSRPFLTGFSFRDGIVDFGRGLAIGDTLDVVRGKLGLTPAGNGQADDAPVQALEIVNAEGNTTLRLQFDDQRRLRQVDYEPYTG